MRDHRPDFEFNFCGDGIAVLRNVDFLFEPDFERSNRRAIQTADGEDWGIQWRLHTCIWAARNALRLEGDFVECGVGRGFMSTGIMEFLDWDNCNRQFYLLDNFSGIVEELCTETELKQITAEFGSVEGKNKSYAKFYATSFEAVRDNFAEWNNVNFVKGTIPATLTGLNIDKVAYLHIDMNSVAPEMAAIEFFWPKMATGSCVVLDDYAFPGYQLQYTAWNEWGQQNGVPVLTLPTGQGLIIKI